ncbi:unnamed protein product [Pseudo-nitzschia multistriata]|uniref:Hydroxyproline O-arabinosyltransferase-like domain-containing protein n=1 Tax=Pseudo-nitzschia multistriata TaxID=183589 RepID=A0A448Z3E6_9STRA|nr:unnamed protein product [Pseudo-nitzschia multistriata]
MDMRSAINWDVNKQVEIDAGVGSAVNWNAKKKVKINADEGSPSADRKPEEKVQVDAKKDSKDTNEKENYFLTHSSPYHTIFSTGCSIYQDWQSYVFFHHVKRSGQEGHVTRIASGCSANDEVKFQEVFEAEIESMNPGKHHLHFTPDFSRVPKVGKKPYKYFNKPYGVRHWMEHTLGYPHNHKLHDDSIIILMDPDQIMLRPFTNDFTNSSELWKLKKKRKLKVGHGSPFAQAYGYGIQWLKGGKKIKKIDHEYVFQDGRLPTPVSNMTFEEARQYYSGMGPVSEHEVILIAKAKCFLENR